MWKINFDKKGVCTIWVVLCSILFPCRANPEHIHSEDMNNRLDAIYVIGMRQCEQRWNHIRAWARQENINVTSFYATRFDEINLHKPPIPILGVPENETISGGQVACTVSHIRVWRDAFRKNYSHIVVMEDDVQLTSSLVRRLPQIMLDAHLGSSERDDMHWHFIYLRIHPTANAPFRERWFGTLAKAEPGWGSAAYMLSQHGIRFLLTRITSYTFPLDVQLERLQRGEDTLNSKFIALDACLKSEDGKISPGCPENVRELSDELRGNCVHHGSQLGNRLKGSQIPRSV
ncbi:Glycosyltransferase 25 [Gracilaria domingensis]|nr:Glycosyltransferase 25 [Gracilaria domingensis]